MLAPTHSAISPAPGTEPLAAVLADLHAACPQLQFSLVATRDGFTMTTLGRTEAGDGEPVGALSAGLLHQCNNAALELAHGDLEQVLLHSRQGYLLLRHAGEQAMLAVVAGSEANVGLVLLEGQRAARRIAEIL